MRLRVFYPLFSAVAVCSPVYLACEHFSAGAVVVILDRCYYHAAFDRLGSATVLKTASFQPFALHCMVVCSCWLSYCPCMFCPDELAADNEDNFSADSCTKSESARFEL